MLNRFIESVYPQPRQAASVPHRHLRTHSMATQPWSIQAPTASASIQTAKTDTNTARQTASLSSPPGAACGGSAPDAAAPATVATFLAASAAARRPWRRRSRCRCPLASAAPRTGSLVWPLRSLTALQVARLATSLFRLDVGVE